MLSDNGALGDLIQAGARILEASCGPCIGMGQAPKSNAISLRTFNRNFQGRCGTDNAGVYLVSPETAAVSAIVGYLSNPETHGDSLNITIPEKYHISNNYFISPKQDGRNTPIVMGPNIKPFPINKPLETTIKGKVLLKALDNVTTDDIMPSHAGLLPYRSNIPELSKYCFGTFINDFHLIAKKHQGGFVVGGENYGQGSSREHAALVPLYLGIKGIIAKSFARIHKANLINSGILPLTFVNKDDYDSIEELDEIEVLDTRLALDQSQEISLYNASKNITVKVKFEGSFRDSQILKAGGYLNYAKEITL
jgi:aconitate hydratase